MQISWGSVFSQNREGPSRNPQRGSFRWERYWNQGRNRRKLWVLLLWALCWGFVAAQVLDSCDWVSVLYQIHTHTCTLTLFLEKPFKSVKDSKHYFFLKPDLNPWFLWQLWKLLTFNTSSFQSPGVPRKLALEQRFLKKQRFQIFYTKLGFK